MAAVKKNHTMDVTAHTAVVVCTRPGCSWRGFSHTAASAWRQLASHARLVHQDTAAAEYATRRATRRESCTRSA